MPKNNNRVTHALNEEYCVELVSFEFQVLFETEQSGIGNIYSAKRLGGPEGVERTLTHRSRKVKKFNMKINGTTRISILRTSAFSSTVGKAVLYDPLV